MIYPPATPTPIRPLPRSPLVINPLFQCRVSAFQGLISSRNIPRLRMVEFLITFRSKTPTTRNYIQNYSNWAPTKKFEFLQKNSHRAFVYFVIYPALSDFTLHFPPWFSIMQVKTVKILLKTSNYFQIIEIRNDFSWLLFKWEND